MNDKWDAGALLFIGAFVVAPLALQRLERVKVKHTALVSALAFLVGVASVLGRPRRIW